MKNFTLCLLFLLGCLVVQAVPVIQSLNYSSYVEQYGLCEISIRI